MTRVTGPMSQLCRSLSTTAAAPKPSNSTILITSKTAAPLSRKYAELLQERGIDAQDAHPRHLSTNNKPRPYPPTRRLRLMQPFSGTASAPARADTSSIDFAYLPMTSEPSAGAGVSELRVPLLPDNFLTTHAPDVPDAPLAQPEVVVIAAHPESVAPAVLTEVEGMGVDGVELKFAHGWEGEAARAGAETSGMLSDIWKGLVEDVFGADKTRKLA